MTQEEAQQVLDELNEIKPEQLEGNAKRVFEAIMKIADERDELKEELDLKDKQIDLMSEQLTTPIHNKEWVKEYYKKITKEL